MDRNAFNLEPSHRLMVEPEGHPADRDSHDARNINLKMKNKTN